MGPWNAAGAQSPESGCPSVVAIAEIVVRVVADVEALSVPVAHLVSRARSDVDVHVKGETAGAVRLRGYEIGPGVKG